MCGTHGVGIVRWRRFCDNWGERGGGRIGLYPMLVLSSFIYLNIALGE